MATTKKSQPATVKRTVKRTAKAGAVASNRMPSAVTLPAIKAAFGTADSTELERLRIITAFKAAGISQRDALASVGKANRGIAVPGFSKGTVGRYYIAASHSMRDDIPTLTAAQGKASALAIIALTNVGTAADVTAAVDVAIKASKTGAQFVTAIKSAATAAGKSAYAEIVKPAGTRGPQGAPALTDGKKSAAGKKTPETAAQPVSTAATLAKASLSDLLAEIDRRVNRTGFTVISSDLAAFESIAAAVQAARDADRVVTIKG